VQKFQDWSGLKISTKKSSATGALYGSKARRGKITANAEVRREKARTAKHRGLAAACEGDDAFTLGGQDFQVDWVVRTIQGHAPKVRCKTCGIVKENHHFHLANPDRCCRQCATTWSPKSIKYEKIYLKTTPGRSTTRLLGV